MRTTCPIVSTHVCHIIVQLCTKTCVHYGCRIVYTYVCTQLFVYVCVVCVCVCVCVCVYACMCTVTCVPYYRPILYSNKCTQLLSHCVHIRVYTIVRGCVVCVCVCMCTIICVPCSRARSLLLNASRRMNQLCSK